MKKIIISVVVFFVLIMGYVFAGPYITMNAIKSDIKNKNTEGLKENIDFPVLRENLKEQMTDMAMRKMQEDKELQNNPFAGLAVMMMPGIINNAIDLYVSPYGITRLSEGKKPIKDGNQTISESEIFKDADTSFESLSKFSIKVKNKEGNDVDFILTRDGISWKLTNIELPKK